MKLLSDRIIVLMDEQKEQNEKGIFIPLAQQRHDDGTVIIVGPEVKKLQPGDRVKKFRTVKGTTIEIDGIEHLILRESGEIEHKL